VSDGVSTRPTPGPGTPGPDSEPGDQEPAAVIYAPSNGRNVSGNVQILGRAAVENFSQYTLEYGAGPNPDQWFNIITVPLERELGVLGIWDVSGLEPGGYTLRLVVRNQEGQEFVTTVVVSVGD
jgi:hypothetical protein